MLNCILLSLSTRFHWSLYCLLLSGATAAAPHRMPLEAFNADVQSIALSEKETLTNDVVQAFARWFPKSDDTAGVSTDLLKDRLSALATVSHLAPESASSKEAWQVAATLENREEFSNEDATRLHRILLAERHFTAAEYLQRRIADGVLAETPTVIRLLSRANPNAYAVSADGDSLMELSLDMSRFTGIVAISHPGCGFSRAAAQWVEREATEAAASPIRWIAPVDGNLMLRTFAAWNAQHPGTPLFIARHERDWPFVSRWDTPQFYRFVDGQLNGHISGWKAEQQTTLSTWLKRQGTP